MLVPSKSCIDEKLSKPEMLNFELNTEGRWGGVDLSAIYLSSLLLVQVLKDNSCVC